MGLSRQKQTNKQSLLLPFYVRIPHTNVYQSDVTRLDATLWIFVNTGFYQSVVLVVTAIYEGWNFNFGNTPLDWIQELLE